MNALAEATKDQVSMLDDLVTSLRAVEETLSRMQAARDGLLALASRLALSMAEEGDGIDTADLTLRTVAAELAAAQRVSDRTMQRRMADAEWCVTRFPLVWAAQGAGRISAAHMRVITDAGEHLEHQADRDAYSARVLELAEQESPGRLRPLAARIAEHYQPNSLEDRHEDAREKRGVWVRDRPDAMADLIIHGPATLVHGAFDRLTGMAQKVSTPDADPETDTGSADQRTLCQKRLDIALDLLLTGAPAGHDTEAGLLAQITANVSITVPFLTLMDSEARGLPAEIDGHGPIDPETARALSGAASGWDRVLTHPVTGSVLHVDRYRPSEQLRRHLRVRDQRCRFPGCGMPAGNSDLDHTQDAALGGSTDIGNLGTLCRRHHVLKHHSPWHVEQLGDGLLSWTSPTGRTYIDKPPPQNTVMFTPAPEPVPPF